MARWLFQSVSNWSLFLSMIKFDYDPRSRKANLFCDETLFKTIRNHFSVKNEGAVFARAKGKPTFERYYAITPKGTFDFGLHEEIQKYLTSKSLTDVEYSDEFQSMLDCGVPWEEIWDGLKFPMRYYQKDTVTECLKRGNGICILATSSGKCYGKSTPILKYDGSISKVEELKVGELLMGPDSTSRTITDLVRGSEMMYKITPIRYADPVTFVGITGY